jgi:acetyl esterase/lipase
MSWQSALACWIVRRRLRPETAKPMIDVAGARAYAARRVWAPKVPAGWRLTEHYAAADVPLRGEWLTPDTVAAKQATILYLHGGGYYFCSPRSHRSVVFPLATLARARAFSLDYRLAPEHRFPCALDDAVAAYRRLLADGIPARSIAIAGDSAGGGLALAMLHALRDASDPLPACAVLFSPWTDLASTGASIVTNDGRDPMFHGAALARAAKLYLGDADPKNLGASPLYGRFDDLPPLLIQAGDTEVLLDDSVRVAEKARAAGVIVDLEIWMNVPHCFQLCAPFMPEANRALARAAAFIRETTSGKAPHRLPETSIV